MTEVHYAGIVDLVCKMQAREISSVGALHGVPIGIEDLCGTREAPTHVGSSALRDWNPGVDATVAARLRATGAPSSVSCGSRRRST